VFVPDWQPVAAALARTTHLGISAHQDDLEIMAIDGILKRFQQPDLWFTGVVVANGSGSPRAGLHANTTDEEMQAIRVREQQKAAVVGDYGAQVLLAHPSSAVRDSTNRGPVQDLITVHEATRRELVYTHNLADKHATHVAVALRVIKA